MNLIWSWADKKHRTRLAPRRWNRLTIVDDKSGETHHGGSVPAPMGITAQGQLYFGLTAGVTTVSIRFIRVYKDGRPDDATGFQDYRRTGKATLNIGPVWVGMMDPSWSLAIEERHDRGYVVQGNTIYKGYG